MNGPRASTRRHPRRWRRPDLRRIGLFGGSFDPPHRAHRALGEVAQRMLALDELRWLPAGAPWQKAGQAMTPPAQRRQMLELLLDEGGTRPPGWQIDDRELHRNGPTYTLDTVRELQAEHAAAGLPSAEWLLVIGQDQFARFDTWHGWPELLQRLTLAVAGRAGQAPVPPAALLAAGLRWLPLDLPAMPQAARDIRAAVARGEAVAPLVGAAVADYIDRQRLYRATP